ncbi:MAG TPA: L-arabinose isomerase [Candidatus Acidoferrales bacterium]|nr:L-arabinose isomerase [Candidatus Acidoferrales bacterium]
MIDLRKYEVWFATGSQDLYGEETLKEVAGHSREIASYLSKFPELPVKVEFKPVLTSPDSVYKLCLDVNSSPDCIGVIFWMHTFSPAKMWIAGLKVLQKPFVHLHTQFNRDLPWGEIDMDFMNLNQSAHGDREFGFICTRMGKSRKVIVGHWQDESVRKKLAVWMRAAAAKCDMQGGTIARFGDNMREVAVTEGDKVEAQMKFGYSVAGYGVGDLVDLVDQASDSEVDKLIAEYENRYKVSKVLRKGGEKHQSLREAAKIEIGLRAFLESGNFTGFTDTFEDLHGLRQLPGLAAQRLMADGYGFGAEGDWKTAALVRAAKVMSAGLKGGTSFMEDYTYHFNPGQDGMEVLGAHMLEICESIAEGKPSLEIAPLSIGGKADPPRLVFDTPVGPAINATIIDVGDRFRLIVNEVVVVPPNEPLAKLPVARAVWIPKPNLTVAAHSWILAGGAHHTAFSQSISAEYLEDFAEMFGMEYLLINDSTNISEFKKELKWNDLYYSSGQ